MVEMDVEIANNAFADFGFSTAFRRFDWILRKNKTWS
jgi:hypothetical protein